MKATREEKKEKASIESLKAKVRRLVPTVNVTREASTAQAREAPLEVAATAKAATSARSEPTLSRRSSRSSKTDS